MNGRVFQIRWMELRNAAGLRCARLADSVKYCPHNEHDHSPGSDVNGQEQGDQCQHHAKPQQGYRCNDAKQAANDEPLNPSLAAPTHAHTTMLMAMGMRHFWK